MRYPLIVLAAALLGAGLLTPVAAGAKPAGAVATVRHACATPVAGHASCLTELSPQAQGGQRGISRIAGAATPPTSGYGPADIASIYQLDTTRGAGQTVAIVDAYDNPHAESDLRAFRTAWKLPACTTANGCFRKINQRGGRTAPQGDPGWGVEIDLDIEAVSAACPLCHILLVEADSSADQDLGTAENEAVKAGAKIVSNSYGGAEFNGVLSEAASYYRHPGVALVASSGDDGFGPALFPAADPQVIAVGGTSVVKQRAGWVQSSWFGASSGCSAWFPKPSWQHDTHCPMRTVADISALADPNTGLDEYDTYDLPDVFGVPNGWVVIGGTSLAAPLIAGMIGLAGNASSLGGPSGIYARRRGLSDVVGGSNGFCGGDYLCTSLPGYDGPTGLGTPKGVGSL